MGKGIGKEKERERKNKYILRILPAACVCMCMGFPSSPISFFLHLFLLPLLSVTVFGGISICLDNLYSNAAAVAAAAGSAFRITRALL